jgi:hypothetical protein
MTILQEQSAQVIDFITAINPETLLYTDADGNLDIAGILTVEELEADGVTTEELCVGGICVDEDNLRELLENAGVTALRDTTQEDDVEQEDESVDGEVAGASTDEDLEGVDSGEVSVDSDEMDSGENSEEDAVDDEENGSDTGTGTEIPVITISGVPVITAIMGEVYSFTPVLEYDGVEPVVFAIVNQPGWTTFDPATGTFIGTPTASSLGTTSNIIITAIAGSQSVVLPAFDLEAVE